MNALHTPGAWAHKFDRPLFKILDGDDNELARVFNGADAASIEANARLIAAAPELLEALRPFAGLPENSEAETAVPNHSPVTIRCQLGDMRRAFAAIAKATGAA